MNPTPFPEDAPANAGSEEIMSAQFASLVVQQTNLALMLLGRLPHPETGQTRKDIEGAKMVIDQLEMLQVKTRGNLDKDEEKLLKQSLTALRMAFVKAVDSPSAQPESKSSAPPGQPAGSAEAVPSTETAGQPAPPRSEDESRKKFSKKY